MARIRSQRLVLPLTSEAAFSATAALAGIRGSMMPAVRFAKSAHVLMLPIRLSGAMHRADTQRLSLIKCGGSSAFVPGMFDISHLRLPGTVSAVASGIRGLLACEMRVPPG